LVVKSVEKYCGRGRCSFDIPPFIYNKENREENFLYLLMKETGLLQEKPLFSWVIRVYVKEKPTLESGFVAKLHCIALASSVFILFRSFADVGAFTHICESQFGAADSG
jgi:hypothetical protein